MCDNTIRPLCIKILGGQFDGVLKRQHQQTDSEQKKVAAIITPEKKVACVYTNHNIPRPYDPANPLLFRTDGAQQVKTLNKFEKIGLNWKRILLLLPSAFFPWTLEYNTVRMIPDRLFQHFPDMIVYVRNEMDIRKVIYLSKKFHLPISIRSGGHIREYFSIQHPLILDTSALNRIKLFQCDKFKQYFLTVGAGVRIGTVYNLLASYNLILPAGTCPSVGLSGLMTGGGLGFSMRLFGLLCDNLVKATIILADGQKVKLNTLLPRTADTTTNALQSDLMYALKGAGGGNFGVISQMTFQVHHVEHVSVFQIDYALNKAVDVIDVFQHWAPDTDTRLTSELDMNRNTVSIEGAFFGQVDELQRLIQPLLQIDTASVIFIRAATVREYYTMYSGNQRFVEFPFWLSRNLFIDTLLSKTAIEIFVDYITTKALNVPGVQSILLWSLGGNIMNHSTSSSSYYPRKARLWWLLNAGFPVQQNEEKVLLYVREYFAAVEPYVGQGNVYCNFPNLDLGVDFLTSYWGSHVSKLRQIKSVVDPNNFWHFTQSIPPAEKV